jgi:hypothetical protein
VVSGAVSVAGRVTSKKRVQIACDLLLWWFMFVLLCACCAVLCDGSAVAVEASKVALLTELHLRQSTSATVRRKREAVLHHKSYQYGNNKTRAKCAE